MTIPTRDDLVKLGLNAAFHGQLSEMRKVTGLSRAGMADLIGVTSEALREWEALRRTMTMATALRIGEWFWAAQKVIDNAGDPIDFSILMPGGGACMMFNVPAEGLLEYLKWKQIDHEDLGVLGVFVYRDQIPALAIV